MSPRKLAIAVGLGAAVNSASCVPLSRPVTEREQTAAVGGVVGGAGGAIIGSLVGSAVTGGLHGLPLGALAGYYIGDRMAQEDRLADSRLEQSSKEIEWLRRENERLRNLLDYLRTDATAGAGNSVTLTALPPVDRVPNASGSGMTRSVSETAAAPSANSCMPKPAHMGKEIDFTLVPANAGMFELTQDTGVGARWRHDFWCTRLAAVFRDLATHRKSAGFAEAMSRLRRQNEEGRPSTDSAIARR